MGRASLIVLVAMLLASGALGFSSGNSSPQTSRPWDPANAFQPRFQVNAPPDVTELAFCGRGLLLGATPRDVVVWSVEGGREVKVLTPTPAGRWGSHIGCSADGRLVAIQNEEGLRVLSTDSWTSVATNVGSGSRPIPSRGSWSRPILSRDGRLLANGDRVWLLPEGREFFRAHAPGHSPGEASFSPDGRLLATIGGGVGDSGWDPTVVLWAVPSGRRVRTIRGRFETTRTGAFGPGSLFAVSVTYRSGNFGVLIWDLAKKAPPVKWPEVLSDLLCFRPDGTMLAWDSGYMALRAFDPRSRKGTIAWLPRDLVGFDKPAFSADGERFALAQGGVVRVWDTTKRP